MTKYLLKRLLFGILSACAATVIVMIMVFSLMNRDLVFASDPVFSHKLNNAKEVYKFTKWEEFGYLDYVSYDDFIKNKTLTPDISDEERITFSKIGRTPEDDSREVKEYVDKFTQYYESKGFTVKRLNAVTMGGKRIASGGTQQLFAYKDVSIFVRIGKYFSHLFEIDNIHNVSEDIGKRKISFTFKDPAYGGDKFSPAIIGNGTNHKYLLYFDDQFPFIHQNVLTVNLGKSFTVNEGVDVFTTMTKSQGSYVTSNVIYPSGHEELSADNIHTATYIAGSLDKSMTAKDRFVDDYTNVQLNYNSMSKIGFSFVLGFLSSLLAYLIGIPAGILMARKKDKLPDKIGTLYIIFSLAVPSLAYIFMVKAIGYSMGIQTTYDMDKTSYAMLLLPIISLMLPQLGNLMKWLRRYMIDQSNSDYVKFARSGGLSEREIFSKHIFKNAAIPIIHGIPSTILGALVGAIITERVYVIPGAGNLLTTAINNYDNNVIVGLTLFYALLSVVSIILGDLLITMVDPRISFVSKAR